MMHFRYVLAGDSADLAPPDRRPDAPIDQALGLGLGARSILLLNMLSEVAIEQIIDRWCGPEGGRAVAIWGSRFGLGVCQYTASEARIMTLAISLVSASLTRTWL
jgi:hypothetical protein